MAHIYVPIISPFSVMGPLHDADDSHIQSHHVAYEIAAMSRELDDLVAQYDIQAAQVGRIQAEYKAAPSNKRLATKLRNAEKQLFASILPHQIKRLRSKLKALNSDMLMMTSR